MRTLLRIRLSALAVMAMAAVAAAGAQGGGAAKPPLPPKPAGAKPAAPKPAGGQPTPGAGPVVVVETARGAFEFETYPDDAPKTVASFLTLVKKGFYNGQRFHRVVPGFVIQAGDPQTRDMTKRATWGRGEAAGSGRPIGVAEFSKKHLHTKGAVAMAHAGDAALADSQFYVTLAAVPRLDGKYAVFGHVISGAEVPATIQVGDVIKRVYVKDASK
jgi:peptidyl-prolyl cis-trans isomerase B (cyclophilin B)